MIMVIMVNKQAGEAIKDTTTKFSLVMSTHPHYDAAFSILKEYMATCDTITAAFG